jgi:hypothetical protein
MLAHAAGTATASAHNNYLAQLQHHDTPELPALAKSLLTGGSPDARLAREIIDTLKREARSAVYAGHSYESSLMIGKAVSEALVRMLAPGGPGQETHGKLVLGAPITCTSVRFRLLDDEAKKRKALEIKEAESHDAPLKDRTGREVLFQGVTVGGRIMQPCSDRVTQCSGSSGLCAYLKYAESSSVHLRCMLFVRSCACGAWTGT